MKNILFIFLKVALLSWVLISNIAFADIVGEITYVRGVVSATNLDQQFRLINKGADLHTGDTIQTSRDSIVVMHFKDDTKMTLRPLTVFSIDEYKFENSIDNSDRGIFSLIKGGFRAITGFLSKSNPDALKFKTVTATLGIRGTEFDARYCEQGECGATSQRAIKNAKSPTRGLVVGRVAFKRGELIAINDIKKKSRIMDSGAPVYEGDRLITSTNSYAVIAFTDTSRITLMRNSQLKVEQYKYSPEEPKQNTSIFNLLKGGLRAVTGAIASLNKALVKYKTITATIGVRGTGFDLVCNGDKSSCESLNVNVWDGTVVIEQPGRETLVYSGTSASVKGKLLKPTITQSKDNKFLEPKPNDVGKDFDELFSTIDMSNSQPEVGLYVSVYDGHVSIQGELGERVDIGAGEAAFSGLSGHAQRLNSVPLFQINDPTPLPNNVTVTLENTLNLLLGEQDFSVQKLECSI